MNNKGFLLISSIFLFFFLGLMVSISLMRSDMQLRSMDLRRASLYAFYAAEAGIERAVFELRRDQTWQTGFANENLVWQGEDGREQETVGFYSVQVVGEEDGEEPPVRRHHCMYHCMHSCMHPPCTEEHSESMGGHCHRRRPYCPIEPGDLPFVWLFSQGQDQAKRVSRYIVALVAVENPATYFTSTIGDISIGSGTDIDGTILGRDIIFEVNEALPPNLREITVDGDVQYIRNIEGEDNPYVDITGNIQQRPPITFISVDLSRYRALAQENGRYIDGDFTCSGKIDWRSLETNNGLVFAEGDIHISGAVAQSIHFVSGRDIYIKGDITTCVGFRDQQTQIGLSAHGDVIITRESPANIDIDAFINADGGLLKAEGDKGSKNELNFEGVIAVRGKEGERTVIDLNVYSKRNYTYDTSLRNNLQIPFMSFIANIIDWRELDKEEFENELKRITSDVSQDSDINPPDRTDFQRRM